MRRQNSLNFLFLEEHNMNPDPGPIGTQLLLLALLTMVNAFFACAEMAIVSVNKTKIGILADEGSKKAKTV